MSKVDSRKIYVDPSKVRKADQLAEYERIFRDGVCPFCLDHREEYTQGTRLYDGENWWLFQNNWPYKNTRRHVMAVSRDHNVYLEDLPADAGSELFEQYQMIETEDGYKLAAIEARFGFVMWTGASVAHFHTHLLIPSADDGEDSFIEEHDVGELLWRGEHWKVHKSATTHINAREHFLIVSIDDASYLNDVDAVAGNELFMHLARIEKDYAFTHGGFHARIGDRIQNGPTKGKIVFEVLTPNDEVYDDPTKKVRLIVSENPPVDFKIST